MASHEPGEDKENVATDEDAAAAAEGSNNKKEPATNKKLKMLNIGAAINTTAEAEASSSAAVGLTKASGCAAVTTTTITTTTATVAAAAAGAELTTTAAAYGTSSAALNADDKPASNDSVDSNAINQECFLLADTTLTDIPAHLELLLQKYDARTLSQAEALFLLVYIMALENGYCQHKDYEELYDELTQLSGMSSYHIRNVHLLAQRKPHYTKDADGISFSMQLRQLTYVPGPCTDGIEAQPVLSTLLSAFVSGDLMMVTMSPMARQHKMIGYSCCLPIGRFVMMVYSKNKPFHQRFRALSEFSLMLRDKVFVPMRCQQLTILNILPNPALQCLPVELYELILPYLTQRQRRLFLNISRRIYYSCCDSKFLRKNRH